MDALYDALGDGGQSLTAGEAEVIEVEIGARQDDRYEMAVGIVLPLLGADIEEIVGHRLEEHIGRELHGQVVQPIEFCI